MQQGMHYSPQRHTYRPFPGDEHLVVKFDVDDRKNEKLTRERGYAVYEDVEIVSIHIPGDKQTTIVAPANAQVTMPDGTKVTYKDRFPEDYERWRQGRGAAVIGMPLKHAPFLSKAEVSMLNGQNIFSVEQLSEMGGAPLKNLGPNGRKWQQQALAFLQTANGSRDATAAAAENAALRDRIAQLEEAMGIKAPEPEAGETEAEDVEPEDEKAALKDQIEQLTGSRPRGNSSVETLKRILAEAQGA